MSDESRAAAGIAPSEKTFLGHPRGLATLFATEMWERFSYYGMRALLILYMTADATKGGLQFDVPTAGSIYGMYTAMVYMTGLPGGWIADRFLGQRKAVLFGGIIIALGHFSMAFHGNWFFFQGLVLIVLGTGLLKPNISTMVGALYSETDSRRDAGFSIFYVGINLGALISPIVCGYLGQKVDWHYGFAAAGIGMTLGLIQYVRGGKYLGQAGLHPPGSHQTENHARHKLQFMKAAGGLIGVIALILVLNMSGVLNITVSGLSKTLGTVILLMPVLYFVWVFVKGEWTSVERKRIAVVAILFLFTVLFWSAFEQAGSTLNLFADRLTDNHFLGFAFPSSWLQSVNSLFLVIFAGVFAAIWVKLGKREPSSPAKFALGLFFVGLGYLILSWGAHLSGPEQARVSPMWLVAVYLCHTVGELCLSPVGLSTVTKLAPQRIAGQMMGIWFLTIALGNYIGGQVAGLFETMPLPTLFLTIFGTTGVAALILAFLVKPIRKLMGGVH
ncbi:MAG TPA: peptide MFS transporter [Bacteroidota bacterium]|jgi:POT family proton-dependent oligopeptide transporter